MASLRGQRALSSSGGRSGCDVLVRCGGIATPAHSCVLASVSKYLERILSLETRKTVSVTLDVSKLFRGIEGLFLPVIDSLYTGVRVLGNDAMSESLLNVAYDTLELQLAFCSTSNNVIAIDEEVVVDDEPLGKTEDNSMDLSICAKCNLLFVSKEEFDAHTKSNCARKLNCQSCGRMFSRVQALAAHLVEVRHGETVCSVCDHVAESQHDAEIHIARHAGDNERPYFCAHCDSRFSTRKRWEKHLPKHSSEAPFVCATCNRGFKWKHALTAHQVIHATEKKFLCQECGFSTSHVSTFRFHTRMHAGNLMKCDVQNCTFQTTRKSNLVQHRLTHSKEKPHQCEVCGRSFSLAKNMRRHARQHDLTATVYTCAVANCSFKSLRSDKYLEHVKKYHPEDGQGGDEKKPTTATTIITSVKSPPPVKSSTLAASPFNTVSPPNKTVTDTFEGTFADGPHSDFQEPLESGQIMTDDEIPPLPL